jgi:hypothetical protein
LARRFGLAALLATTLHRRFRPSPRRRANRSSNRPAAAPSTSASQQRRDELYLPRRRRARRFLLVLRLEYRQPRNHLSETTLEGAPADGTVASSGHTAFTFSSPTGTIYRCTLNGTEIPCASDLNLSAEGTYTLTIAAGISPFGDEVVYYDKTPGDADVDGQLSAGGSGH